MSQIARIVKEPMGNKDWVKVYFANGTTWIPKISEIAIIAHKIGLCEDEKYNFPRNNVKGAEMVSEYIHDAILLGSDSKTIEALNRKYKIPPRTSFSETEGQD